MFFQGALCLAYLYAHLLAERLERVHLLVVAVALFWMPPSVGLLDLGDSSAGIATELLLSIGLPFAVLASTAIVAQRWVARGGADPYGLYAISNAGSLVGLFGYALVVEPLFPLGVQRWAWAMGLGVYVALAVVAWRARPRRALLPTGRETWTEPPPTQRQVYWAALAAAPSAFLMGVTNLIALDAGHAPLVWVVPLAIYLGSFVWAFARPVPGLVRRLWPHVALVGLFFFSGGDAGGGWLEVGVQLVVLGFVSLAAHGELHRARPASHRLTLFYLLVALGGWIGGAFVALLAPPLFGGLWEYPLALALLGATLGWAHRERLRAWLKSKPWGALAVTGGLVLVIVFKVGDATLAADATETLAVERSFHGLYRVTRTAREDGAVRDLVSGNTRHGRQREGDTTPLSYYHPAGPLGDAWEVLEPTRIGAVGLGVGAAAGHLAPGERMRFFEIDPVVVELAQAHFTFLRDARGHVDVVTGDARVSLESDEGAAYDLLLVDAFAGDAIPSHLLTIEAIRVYLRRLAPSGVLLFHVSNRYYGLRPVLRANAAVLGLVGAHIADLENLERDQDPSEYVALARDAAPVAPLLERGWQSLEEGLRAARPWTDEQVHTLSVLR